MKIHAHKHYVYEHRINGVMFYIGKGNSGRVMQATGRNPKWRERVSANGGEFEACIVGVFDTAKEALDAENALIRQHRPECNYRGCVPPSRATKPKPEPMDLSGIIALYGSVRAAAQRFGITHQAIYAWKSAGTIPLRAQKHIQAETRGKLRAEAAA